jgi:hypothetical protein
MDVRSLVPTVTLAFALGALSSQFFVRDARAQALPFAATVYVPSDGIAFRSFDGHVVARLSYDAHGGIFDVYNEREQVAARLRADSVGRGSPLARPDASSRVPPAPFASPDDVGF